VVVDCGAIPPTLIESELFGHEKGAFTGAERTRVGAFEAAHGGTLLLDEVGELPLEMQPKLLRALEDRVVKRVGTTSTIPVDVRVIAATNRDLRLAVNRGAFRPDLLYRLNTVRLRIPPLRDRRDDIPLYVEHFYEQFTRGAGAAPAELISSCLQQEWPGNVRELRSAVERAVLMGDASSWSELTEPSLPLGAPPDVFDPLLSFRVAKERAVARWERWYVNELYSHAGRNLSKAARGARMDRAHLRELLRRYRMPMDDE
jgi:transcriptional regulator with GAF, ATPase, and Fis domain